MDALPYVLIVLCCAQFPAGLALGVFIGRYDISLRFQKRQEKVTKGLITPTKELDFADID